MDFYNSNFVSNEILKFLENNRSVFEKKKHEGSQSLTIQSFIFVGKDGIPLESIEPKQDVTAYILLRLNRPLSQDFHFSIQIHDRQGTPLMVVRDSGFDDVISGNEGDVFVVSMRFSLPLQASQYYCRAGVVLLPPGKKYVDGYFNFENGEVADLVEYAAYFRVLPYTHHYIPVPVLNETKMNISLVTGA